LSSFPTRRSSDLVKQIFIVNQSVFDDFGKSGSHLPFIQCVEKFSADKDCLRLGKSPDNIFYVVQIDARLTANGGVYLGEQGRRNLDEIYPSLIGRGRESPHIGNPSSAQIDHQCFSVCTEIQHRFP